MQDNESKEENNIESEHSDTGENFESEKYLAAPNKFVLGLIATLISVVVFLCVAPITVSGAQLVSPGAGAIDIKSSDSVSGNAFLVKKAAADGEEDTDTNQGQAVKPAKDIAEEEVPASPVLQTAEPDAKDDADPTIVTICAFMIIAGAFLLRNILRRDDNI